MEQNHNLQGLRVLVVEDEGLIAMMMEDFLDELGCEVVATAARLEDGLTIARTREIDLAVLDVNLAGTLSYPIAKLLHIRNIPFVFATGYGTPAVPEGLPAVPVLAKPFQLKQLADALGAVIRR